MFPAGATTEQRRRGLRRRRRCPTADVADLLASLVDKSLLQPVADGTRLRMLETIREYGVERLAERRELADDPAARTRTTSPSVVREASRHLRGAGQLPWIRRLEAERDNVVAALRYLADEGHAQQALEIAAGDGRLLDVHSEPHAEAATWLPYALGAAGEADRRPAAARQLHVRHHRGWARPTPAPTRSSRVWCGSAR